MITKEMIQNGFDAGIISIEDSFEGCISLCCRIWDNAFYFAGKEGDLTIEEYFKIHTMDDVINTLYAILKDASSAEEHGLDEGEWNVYSAILHEYYEKTEHEER